MATLMSQQSKTRLQLGSPATAAKQLSELVMAWATDANTGIARYIHELGPDPCSHGGSGAGVLVKFDVHAGVLLDALSCSITPAMTSGAMNDGYRLESIQRPGTLQLGGWHVFAASFLTNPSFLIVLIL